MDQMVLQTQQWLNKTYGSLSDFDKVPEDGKTGWATIYGLIEGLQHELGISPLTQAFGPNTASKFESYFKNTIQAGVGSATPNNVLFLIQGAFWCKGISPGSFNGLYIVKTQQAIVELINDAGFDDPSAIPASLWGKALFDMAAFVNIGDESIREMQQWLNRNYYDYFGIMPCDGIYQRDTNTALIYALQAEEGLAVGTANGAYGPTTTRLTPYLQIGDSENSVKILQYGLYVNGFNPNKIFDGVYSTQTDADVRSFSQFMVIPGMQPSYGAGVSVIKALLSSAGDTNRSASGADTATQLSPEQIQTLVDNEVKYIGRYLTGSVGIGSDERDKFLTITELQNLFNAGISVFPIYQDGGYYLEYFDAAQGTNDANQAVAAAINLNIPVGTTIYFAVDVDIQDGDIAGTVLPYFETVYNTLTSQGYHVGIYGTRNVCTQVIDAGFAMTAFVSDMSTGYSGNLGFPMPQAWAFDQFIEFTIGDSASAVDIDNVAVSGRDSGFNHFGDSSKLPVFQKVIELGGVIPGLKAPALKTVEFQQEFMLDTGAYHIYTTLAENWTDTDASQVKVITVVNGKIENEYLNAFGNFYDTIKMPLGYQQLSNLSDLVAKIYNGNIAVYSQTRREEPTAGVVMKIQSDADLGTGLVQKFEWVIEIYSQLLIFVQAGVTDEQYNHLPQILEATTTVTANSIRSAEVFFEMLAQSINNPTTVERVAPFMILGIVLVLAAVAFAPFGI
ncbi:MAG: DUF1906 domain-containing protein [Streptococcaceae bacterium]|nr:DUF1906 domain-containing protein [Streptococcaceae bacterium]